MTRAEIIARTISRHGTEPTRRGVRELGCRASDAEIDAALAIVLEADGWIVDPREQGKASTSETYRATRKQRDRINSYVKNNDPFFFNLPKPPKGAS